jgi:hypothetical protein
MWFSIHPSSLYIVKGQVDKKTMNMKEYIGIMEAGFAKTE